MLLDKAISRLRSFRARRRQRAFRGIIGAGLRPDAERQLLRLQDEVGFAGKRILEIGGDIEGNLAGACLALGAKHVTSINHASHFQPREDERSRFLRMDAADLDFPAGHFDFVIGLAVLEHIRGLEQVLENIHRVTSPGGFLYLQGGPLWFSRKGHHLILIGASGQHWRFDGRQGSIDPLEDWEHLKLEPADLLDSLVKKGCPDPDAGAIVDYIFRTDLINRYSATHIKQCFESSRFAIRQCTEMKKSKGPTDIVPLLARRHSLPVSEFHTSSIALLVRK